MKQKKLPGAGRGDMPEWAVSRTSAEDRAQSKRRVHQRAQMRVQSQQHAAAQQRRGEVYTDAKLAKAFKAAIKRLDAVEAGGAAPSSPQGLNTESGGWSAFKWTAEEAKHLEKRDAIAIRDYAAGVRPPCPLTKYLVESRGHHGFRVSAFIQKPGSSEWEAVGHLSADDDSGNSDVFTVGLSTVPFAALATCPGLGTKLYEEAAAEACRRGSVLAGSGTRSAFSERFWKRQVAKGRARCETVDCDDVDQECAEYGEGDCIKWDDDSRECLEEQDPDDVPKVKRLWDAYQALPEGKDEKAFAAYKAAYKEAEEDRECVEWGEAECEEHEVDYDNCLEYEDKDCEEKQYADVYDHPHHDLRQALLDGTLTVPQYNSLRRGLPDRPRMDQWECASVPLKNCSTESLRGLRGVSRFRLEAPITKRYRIESR